MSGDAAVQVIQAALDALPADARPSTLVNRDRAEVVLAALEETHAVVALPDPDPREDDDDVTVWNLPGDFRVGVHDSYLPGEVWSDHHFEPLEPLEGWEVEQIAGAYLAALRMSAARAGEVEK